MQNGNTYLFFHLDHTSSNELFGYFQGCNKGPFISIRVIHFNSAETILSVMTADSIKSVERLSENFDQEAVTYLIFFVGTH